MLRTIISLITVFLLGTPSTPAQQTKLTLVPQRVTLTGNRTFTLNLPAGYVITPAVQGLKRVRFMAESPDKRIFVTDMYNLADNTRGVVYILDQFDPQTKTFKKVSIYLTRLRNPNSVAFYTDPQGTHWLYLALTDRLLRYRYQPGENTPTSEPQVLAKFPDYGLSYKYGGWHLTRTIAIGGNGKVYISVGSSCNSCEEKEEVRATIVEMDPDGKNQRYFARGLRNAVGVRWVNGGVVATNMGSDHLGDHIPADTMYRVTAETHYGWPYCYQSGPRRLPDPKLNARSTKMKCGDVPQAFAAFDAHSSPLGLEYFDGRWSGELKNSFLVGLHGSTKKQLGHGYRVVRLSAEAKVATPEDFITGFIKGMKVNGRPVDILKYGENAFLLTDDSGGVVYYVYKE